MTRKHSYVPLLLLLLLLFPLAIWGQTDLGTITGVVKDPSGAVVPSVDVVATQVGTGMQFKTKSNNLGYYSLVSLPARTYDITFHKAGFKDLERMGIVLEVEQTLEVNAELTVGAVSQTVIVNTAPPVLQLQSEVGTDLTAPEMANLPLAINSNARDITALAYAITPNASGNEYDSRISGSQAMTTGVYINGTSATTGIIGDLTEEGEPSMDAIQESQTDTAGISAADGLTGGGVLNYTLKSGTNRFHGSTFGFGMNEALNANDWTNNWYISQCAPGDTSCVDTYRRPYYRYYDYGFSGGGSIWRKWLGIKKMYIFAAYEKYMQQNWGTDPTGGTVPDAKELAGNFSELLTAAAQANGCSTSPCPIMNGTVPYTDSAGNTIYYGSIFSPQGTVYPGNIIPAGSISPLSQNFVKLYQEYYKPAVAGVINNYPSLQDSGFVPWFHETQLSFNYDWDIGPQDHINASYIYTLRPRLCTGSCGNAGNTVLWQKGTTTGGPLTHGSEEVLISNAYRVNETHTFSPDLLNVAYFTFPVTEIKTVSSDCIGGCSEDWPDQVGMGNVQSLKNMPLIDFNGSPNGLGETDIGAATSYVGGSQTYGATVDDTLTWIKGRHTVKFGFQYEASGQNNDAPGGGLEYNFSNVTDSPANATIQAYTGSAFANFLLGEVSSASQAQPNTVDSRRKELAFWGQDDVRIGRRLLVTASLRWELPGPLHVLGGKWSNYSTTAINPLYGIPGTFAWLSSPNGTFETYTDWHQLGPRLGLSYQATNNIVVRASGGINYVPLGYDGYSATPYGSDVGFTGIDQILDPTPETPAFQWDTQTYAGVYTPATGPDPDSAADQSSYGPTNIAPNTRMLGYTENWFFGMQYELPAQAVLFVNYEGNSGRNLHDSTLDPLNYPTWSTYQSLLKSGNVEDWVDDSGSAATAGVPYPYSGWSGEAAAAILPFPQTGGPAYLGGNYNGGIFFVNQPIGQSGYNAFTVEAKKQRGYLNLDLSYNWSRTSGDTSTELTDEYVYGNYYQNPYDYKQEARYAPTYDTVKGYLTYVLPFGRGRRFLSGTNRLVNDLVSGWEGSTIVAYSNAAPMGAIGSTNNYPGWSAVYTNVAPGASFKNTFKAYDPAWNPSIAGEGSDPDSQMFNPANFSNPTYGDLGNSPSEFTGQGFTGQPAWRGWAAPSENAGVMKKIAFGSENRFTLTLTADFFDVFNRHAWDNPDTSFGTPYFGHVTGDTGEYRTGQLGSRLSW